MSTYNKKVMDTGMFWLLILGLVFFISLALTGCGDDFVDDKDSRDQIVNCINAGGKPEYTAYTNGEIAQYFGCVYP